MLVVDHERQTRESLRSLLEVGVSARVLTASSAAEGVGMLHGGVDLVVADYRAPGPDGVAFLSQARRRNPRALLLLLTSSPEPALQDAVRAGTRQVRVLPKAIASAQLLAEIRGALAAPASVPATDERPAAR